MSNNALTDAGVGRALFTTRVRLSLQAAIMCFTFGALPAFALPYAIWFYRASPVDVDIVRLHIEAKIWSATTPHRWRVRDESGERMVLTVIRADGEAIQWMTAPQAVQVLRDIQEPMNTFRTVMVASAFTAVGAYLLVWLGLRRLGSGRQQNRRLRGAATMITAKELDRQVRGAGASAYKFVDVTLPREAPMTGILALGSQGSGKSLAIHDLMQQVFKRKRKCVIYDQNGECFSRYFRPDKDFFFNPACLGSVPWSIFAELQYNYDADTLAEAFLPLKQGGAGNKEGFFENAARAVFSVILLRLTQLGATDTRDIARAFLEMPADDMDHLIRNSVASSAIGGDSKQQRQGVISSISIYLNGIAAVQPGRWSLRQFIDGPDDSRLFIVGTEDTRAMFAPLYRLMLTVCFNLIAAKRQIVHEDRFWFFLDEVHSLQDIKLDEHLALLRKNGVCIASGAQSDSQMVALMGKDRAATVMNCFNTVLLLRANEEGMQERAAKRLGRVEMDTVARSQALAVTEWRDGAGLNNVEGEKWLVMPSDFGSLKTCTGFLKFVGEYPVAKVDYRSWLPRRPGQPIRIDAYPPVVPLPERDPAFLVQRVKPQDAFAVVKQELAALQAAKAQAEADSSSAGGSSPGGMQQAVEGPIAAPAAEEPVVIKVDSLDNATSANVMQPALTALPPDASLPIDDVHQYKQAFRSL